MRTVFSHLFCVLVIVSTKLLGEKVVIVSNEPVEIGRGDQMAAIIENSDINNKGYAEAPLLISDKQEQPSEGSTNIRDRCASLNLSSCISNLYCEWYHRACVLAAKTTQNANEAFQIPVQFSLESLFDLGNILLTNNPKRIDKIVWIGIVVLIAFFVVLLPCVTILRSLRLILAILKKCLCRKRDKGSLRNQSSSRHGIVVSGEKEPGIDDFYFDPSCGQPRPRRMVNRSALLFHEFQNSIASSVARKEQMLQYVCKEDLEKSPDGDSGIGSNIS